MYCLQKTLYNVTFQATCFSNINSFNPVSLKNESYFTRKKSGIIWEQQRIAIWDKKAITKTIGKYNKGEEHYFMEKKKEVGSACFEPKSIGENQEFRR